MPTDARAKLLAAIRERTRIVTVPCHCVDANGNACPDCTCDHGKRYEERTYDFYALLDAFEVEVREAQKREDAEIVERERDSIDTCCDALLLHTKRAILRGGEEKLGA